MGLRRYIPAPLLSAYHFSLAMLGALIFGFPSRKIPVIAVTGTKGKTSVTEMLNAIFEEANYHTALINSARIKVGDDSRPNWLGRSMPGRFFLQRFLARAYREECDIAIIEMTSEGARQHRHRGIALDALVFLNLAPEHIESHGSLQKYADAKFELAKQLVRSRKRPRIVVANASDRESARYLALPIEKCIAYSLAKHAHESSSTGGWFDLDGTNISIKLPGEFSLENALAASEVARAFDVRTDSIARGLAKLGRIPGRLESIDEGQDFKVIVDYAHTPESLSALLDAFAPARRICVFGLTGGGRDKWKRPIMGKIAEERADLVILTSDASYDEKPEDIMREIAAGMSKKPEMIADRFSAIRAAIEAARTDDVVLLVGMGTDRIVDANGSLTEKTDANVAREELGRRAGRV